MSVEAEVVAVPEQVFNALKDLYGIDYELHREVNSSCPSHKKFLEDMYYCHFEEVRILVMKHHKEPIEGIEIL